MKLCNRTNTVYLGGYVSNVTMKNGQYGPFGSITIAIDDGYRDVKNGGVWVDRSQFIKIEISGKNLPDIGVGDFLEITGKLAFDSWVTESGENRSSLKVKMISITAHLTKEAIGILKQAGFGGKQQQQQPQQQRQQQQPPQQQRQQQPQQQRQQQQPPQQQRQQQQQPQQQRQQQQPQQPYPGNWDDDQPYYPPQDQQQAQGGYTRRRA